MSKRKKSSETLKNIIFISIVLIFLILIFCLSLKSNRDNNKFISIDLSEFEHISVIGIPEYQASLTYNGTSVILLCSNEEELCYNELKALDEISEKYKIIIEYINILELVDSEMLTLTNTSNITKENLYPHLLIIENGEIINDSNKYLNEQEIVNILKNHKIIN